METIKYQGQPIEVEHVEEINTAWGEGNETLYRDEQGIYYLERDRTGQEQCEGSRCREDFYSIHRVNITAAILWSIGNLRNPILRMEAADCLMDVRVGQYTDYFPHRYHEIKKARGKQGAARWVKKVLAGTALPAQPAKRLPLDAAKAAVGEDSGVKLDENAGELLREHLANHPHDTVADVVNGAMEFMLGEPDETGLTAAGDAIRWAEERRLEKAASGATSETVTINLVGKEDGREIDTLEIPRESFDEIERRAKENGQDFATYFVEMVRKAVAPAEAQAAPHRLPIDLTCKQFGMLWQAARYMESTPEDFIMDTLRGAVVCYLTDIYGHEEERAHVGWDGFGQKPPKYGRIPRPPVPEAELPITEETRAILEKRARVEGTDLRTQYEFMTAHGANAVFGFDKSVRAELDPFHGDLLRAFERRHGVDAESYARAILEWHLEEIYDFGWNGGEAEPSLAQSIRKYGRNNPPLTKDEVVERCKAAGLNPADYPNAVDKDEQDDTQTDETSNPVAGRRHVADPADIALLAAAEPEPIGKPPAPPKSKAKRSGKGKEGK